VIDAVITIGGDGTLLHVSSLFEKSVLVLSFNMGTLGFLMPFGSSVASFLHIERLTSNVL
jgi:NAD kinase